MSAGGSHTRRLRLFRRPTVRLGCFHLLGCVTALFASSVLSVPLPSHAATLDMTCEVAAAAAEQQAGVPPGMLAAIGRVEAGRWDRATGTIRIWPWSINVNGAGIQLQSAAAATSTVATWVAQGTRSIDVGCFQINLGWHPDAFATLSDAFDPSANARYAAQFLVGLHAQTGDWGSAIARYHSAREHEGISYRSLVFSAWAGGRQPSSAEIPVRVIGPIVTRPSLAFAGIHVFYGAIRMPR